MDVKVNGNIIGKYSQGAGDIVPLSDGCTITDVSDQTALDAITIYQDTQIEIDTQVQQNRMDYLDALIAGDTATMATIATNQASLVASKAQKIV